MAKSKFTKLLCLVLSLVMILGAAPITGITALAADELTETIPLAGSANSVSGTHFNVTGLEGADPRLGMAVSTSNPLVIKARKDETITKVVLEFSLLLFQVISSEQGTFDGNNTFSDINAKEITINYNTAGVCYVSSVTVYYLGDAGKPSVTVTGGANASVSGGWTTQQYLPGVMDTLVYTAIFGASFEEFEPYTKDGITVRRNSSTEVTVSGTPTGNTQITVPDAVTKGKYVTYYGEEFEEIGMLCTEFGENYTDENSGLTFSATGDRHSIHIMRDMWDIMDDASLTFATSEGKIANITINYGSDADVQDSNWTSANGKVTWSGTPSDSVTLSGWCTIMRFNSITFFILPPHVHTFATDWSSDENAHWHACIEEYCDIEDYATNTVEGIAYGTHDVVNGVCTVCKKSFIEFTADNNVLTAAFDDSRYTLTLTENGTISAEEISAWEAVGLTVPEIAFDAAANTASITVEGATATVTLAEDALQAHSVKVICGADADGKSYITDVMPGTAVTVTAGTYEGKLFDKWISVPSIDGSTDETVTFRMPNEDVTVEAEFVDCYALSVFDGTTLTSEPQKVGYSATVTVPATPEGTRFTGWTAEGITLDDAMAATITFSMPANAVMLTANFAAIHTVSVTGGTTTGTGKAIAGETVSVTADADNNDSRFTEWSSEADITFADKTAKTTTFTMPDADVSVTAEREQSYTVTVTDGTASGLNGAGKAFAGDTITVTAGTFSGHNFTGWTGEGVEFDNAANTTTTFTMPEGNVTVKANHEAIKVAIPTAGTKTYTYSGDYQGYEFANEGDKSYYTLSGNVQINAGTYTVKAHLTVAGTVWADGTTADKEYTFVINRQPVDKPIAYNTQYYYTGAEQSFILCRQVNGSYYYYETTIPSGSVYIRGNTRTDAGSQAVTVTPADNYCWQDGTTGTLYFSFTINRYPIPTLFDDPRSFTYNGNAQTYTPFVMRNGKLYDFDGLYYNLSNRTQTAAGSYTVTATLRNNFCWYDGSTAARNFSFNIRMKELDSFIYYVNDLKTGENEVCVDMTYTSYDKTNTLKGFESRPGFKPEMLKDRYQPCLMNVPAGADVMFYLKETPGTPKNISEVSKCKRWNDVKMSDLRPNTIYYMFAVVTHPDYPGFQITEVNNMSRFITSVPQFTLINCKHVKQTEVNQSYKFDCAMAIYTGNINAMLGAFGNKSTSKYVNVTTKVANYTNIEDALAQAIKDIEGGLDGALIGWYDEHGVMQSFSVFPSNLDNARKALANLTKKSVVRSAPKNMLAAPAGDPAPVEITGISGEVPELTDELLNSMFTPEELSVLPLDTAAFKMEMELETGADQIEDEKEALLAKLAALDIMPDEESDEFFGTVRIDSFLYDMKTEAVDGGTVEYKLGMGEKLPADAVKEIEGYTFIGLYYAEIMGFEKDSKSEEATGDHGMILTQGLVKWDPETDIVTRDLDLMALYVKDGAEEPVDYTVDGTTFLDEGSEAVITLPAIMDGMTYGDVVNDNADINVSAINDGKVTVTLANDVTGEEPFTFTVGVNANKEGIEDPFYYIVVTINAVEASDIKEDTETAIEALADDTASDEVKAIIAEAVAALADANSIEAVNEILANAKAAVALQKAKEEAIAAIDEALGEDATDEMVAAADEAKAAVEAAETLDEVEAAKEEGLTAIDDADGRCPYCGEKGHKNWIDKLFCFIKRIVKLIEMLFGFADDVKAL